jgi:hypothetical protein
MEAQTVDDLVNCLALRAEGDPDQIEVCRGAWGAETRSGGRERRMMPR